MNILRCPFFFLIFFLFSKQGSHLWLFLLPYSRDKKTIHFTSVFPLQRLIPLWVCSRHKKWFDFNQTIASLKKKKKKTNEILWKRAIRSEMKMWLTFKNTTEVIHGTCAHCNILLMKSCLIQRWNTYSIYKRTRVDV